MHLDISLRKNIDQLLLLVYIHNIIILAKLLNDVEKIIKLVAIVYIAQVH